MSQESADVGEGQVEAGGVGDEPQVAGEGEAGPGAGRHAVDGRDHRLGHAGQRRDDRVVVRVDGVEQLLARRAGEDPHVLLEVLAGAERAAGAGEHHAAGGRVVGDRRTVSSSSSLVATSRLFIASGRFSVMVATPVGEVEADGGGGRLGGGGRGRAHGGSLPDPAAGRRRGSARRSGRPPA